MFRRDDRGNSSFRAFLQIRKGAKVLRFSFKTSYQSYLLFPNHNEDKLWRMSSPLVLFRGRSNRVVTVLIAFLSIDQFLQLQMINDLSFDITFIFCFIVTFFALSQFTVNYKMQEVL